MQPGKVVTLVCFLLLILPTLHTPFSLSSLGKGGKSLITTVCNIQTTLEFQFSSSTTLAANGALTNGAASTLMFLTAAGNDVTLTLNAATYQTSSNVQNFVTGYGNRATSASSYTATPSGAFIFKFSDSASNTVYVYIPIIASTTTDAATIAKIVNNPDTIDLTLLGGSLSTFTYATPLSAFNFLNQNNYNLWYTAVSGSTTILVSSYIYRIGTVPTETPSTSSQYSSISAPNWNTLIQSTGDKLCYASTVTVGNFQTHMRESVPLWFAWMWIFFFWLFYLCSDSTNVKVYDPHYEDNRWTCVTLYSLANLAHEECFTRLSRSTVILINWSIQGVIIACIYGNQFLGGSMIIWTAVVAFAATLPVPFLLGCLIHSKIYEKNLIKYENMKAMKGVIDKEKLEPIEQAIDTCEEKLYGYYHWFYALAIILTFICWPIAINQMQKLPRTLYHYHWYWLASMGVVFVIEYLIFEPLFALIFGSTSGARMRGGQFYNFKLGQAYRAAQTL